MDWKFVLALIFALIVAVFALQNAAPVEISFLTMELSISQALVILLSAAFGALAVLLLSLVRWIKYKSKIINQTKTISALEQENRQLKLQVEDKNSPLTENRSRRLQWNCALKLMALQRLSRTINIKYRFRAQIILLV